MWHNIRGPIYYRITKSLGDISQHIQCTFCCISPVVLYLLNPYDTWNNVALLDCLVFKFWKPFIKLTDTISWCDSFSIFSLFCHLYAFVLSFNCRTILKHLANATRQYYTVIYVIHVFVNRSVKASIYPHPSLVSFIHHSDTYLYVIFSFLLSPKNYRQQINTCINTLIYSPSPPINPHNTYLFNHPPSVFPLVIHPSTK